MKCNLFVSSLRNISSFNGTSFEPNRTETIDRGSLNSFLQSWRNFQNIINVISQWIWWKRRRFYVIWKEIFFIKNIWAILRDRKWSFPRTTDTILYKKDRNRDRCQERIIELAMRYKMLLFIHLLYGFNFSCSTL